MTRAAGVVRSPAAWLLTTAIVLIALNLRGPIVATAPVLRELQSDLGLSAVVAGLLTTIPVLCFAVASPAASALIVRAGAEKAVSIGLIGVMIGTVIRSVGGSTGLFVGVVVIGIAITIGNVVLPVIIRRDFSPERAGLVTGVYTSALNVGSMITTLGTAPLAGVIGWRWAIAAWALIAVVALVVWSVAVSPRVALGSARLAPAGGTADVTDDARGPETAGSAASGVDRDRDSVDVLTGGIPIVDAREAARARTPLLRRWTTWGLTLAFGGQAFSYYGLTAWIPTLLGDEVGLSRESAGASSSVFQIMAVVGALGVPLLALKVRPSYVIAAISVLWMAMPLGLLFRPDLWLVWSIFGGAAQGGGITIVFIVIVRMATTNDDARRLSAFVQGGGYALGSLGPLAIGGLHTLAGDWRVPMIGVFVSVLVLGFSGVLSSRRVR
ncbi:CynX/NimT family MFS transporter [Frigoribacterium sp. 2-23]|uniref:MFS transporter n=1 Tax=Frigoribacterium sp. 2-23 TaxID=3415006 RepID=UPI003C6F7493